MAREQRSQRISRRRPRSGSGLGERTRNRAHSRQQEVQGIFARLAEALCGGEPFDLDRFESGVLEDSPYTCGVREGVGAGLAGLWARTPNCSERRATTRT